MKPEKISNYQPINLCKVSYKFISKLLDNGPRMLLPKIISLLQSAFASNRDINDNIVITDEILTTLSNLDQKEGLWLSN